MKEPLFFILILSAIFSCMAKTPKSTKEPDMAASIIGSSKIPSVEGRWQLTASFSGYVNGGDFKWHDTPKEQTVEFKSDGNFEMLDATNPPCTGKYELLPEQKIKLNISCQQYEVQWAFSELTDSNLIFDFQGREGTIRKKYVRLK